MANEEFDLVVIGGGPGGATVSTLVAQQGHRVLLLEKDQFPRHQIGESLLPATIHGICPLLGVSAEIEQANFMRKLGGTFRWGKKEEPWTFYFSISPQMAGPTGFAYQVERSKFDKILLDNAARKGVEVRQRSQVEDVISHDGRVGGVMYTDADGARHAVRSKFVVDTSGNRSRVHDHVGQRVYSKFFQNLALFGYYENGKRLPAPNDGNILCAAFDGGWFWYIPLTDKLTSVGAVIDRSHAALLQQDLDGAMSDFIASCPMIEEYLKDATRVTEGEYGELRVRKDYSYCCDKFWAPGMVLAGDAACFVDPVFSSGVHLATYSGLLAARSINSILRDGMDETRAFTEYEMRYRREYGNFYQFLVSFYDLNNDEDSYYWSARKVINSEEKANEAFVRLVAGVSTSGEPLFGTAEELFDAMHSIGNSFEAAVSKPGQFDQTKLDRKFMAGFTRELSQVQMQALAPESMAGDTPLWRAGLVPSADGLHWREMQASP